MNISHAWLYEFAISTMQKKLKLSSDGGDSGNEMQAKLWWGV
jgi:hypothetical protein